MNFKIMEENMNKNLSSLDLANQSQPVIRISPFIKYDYETGLAKTNPANLQLNQPRIEPAYNSVDVPKIPPNGLPYKFSDDERKMWLLQYSEALGQSGVVKYFNCNFYWYTQDYFSVLDDNEACMFLSEQIRENGVIPTYDDVKFVLNQVKINAQHIHNIATQYYFIQYQNVIINIFEDTYLQPSQQLFTLGRIEAKYIPNPTDDCPSFNKFLHDISNGDVMLEQRIWEFVAYCITPDFNAKRLFILYGVGDSGKSVLLRVIQSLISSSLVTNMSIKNLVSRGFATGELQDKRLIIASDEGNFNLTSEHVALLKRISGGGETLTADVKFKSQVTFLAIAKICIATNCPIHATASAVDPAFKNRLMIIPFNHAIPKEQQDSNLYCKIMAERNVIVTRCYLIYQALRTRNYVFTGDYNGYDEVSTFVPGNMNYNKLKDFSQNHCIFDNESFTYSDEIFKAFCNMYSSEFADLTSFSQAFYNINSNRIQSERKRTDSINRRGYRGIRLI